MRGLFVTGTDTEVGKSVLSAAVCATLAAAGERVAAFKPVVTGLDEPTTDWPRDHELLASVASAGQAPEDVAPKRYGPAVSPHLAAELAGETLEPHELVRAAHAAGQGADALLCEGVGGLMVPLTRGYLVRDFAIDMHLPLVIAARPGLGTISHTLLTVEAARTSGLEVRGVVLTPWPDQPSAMELSNRTTIEALARAPVSVLPFCTPETLAEAGSKLPLEEWLR